MNTKAWMVVALSIAFSGCATSTLQNRDFADEFALDAELLNPKFVSWNFTLDSTLLAFEIPKNQVLFQADVETGIFSANLLLRFHVFASYKSKEILDSTSLKVTDVLSQNSAVISGTCIVGPQDLDQFYIRVTLMDMNRTTQTVRVIEVNRATGNNPQNFIVREANGEIVYEHWLGGDKELHITHLGKPEKLFVNYYNADHALARPPYSTTEEAPLRYTPDSSYVIEAQNENFILSITQEGAYHLRVDTSNREGLMLLLRDKAYPMVTLPSKFLGPVQYLTTREEFEVMHDAENPKLAVENFWLTHAGSKERARELIRAYYSRVEHANRMFTSYKEGWKTDRGLTYIIYGLPNSVYRSETTENWVYLQEGQMPAQTFEFHKIANPFTANHYRMVRTAYTRPSWNMAVQAWRQGRIISGVY